MNVLDVATQDIPKPTKDQDMIALIFQRQRQLMEKYHLIEAQNGLLQTADLPVDIHNRHGQSRLKDFAWRVTEELAEATQAKIDHPNLEIHFLEELSDAYHFLIELTIISGMTENHLYGPPKENVNRLKLAFIRRLKIMTLKPDPVQIHGRSYQIIQSLGNAMNCLKNKPWKVTHHLTDINQYMDHINTSHSKFIELCLCFNLSAEDLFNLYFKKSEVNLFRQRSDY
jgi:dimeric dUTPase (all-alpha-NTP-PPase superfamily)